MKVITALLASAVLCLAGCSNSNTIGNPSSKSWEVSSDLKHPDATRLFVDLDEKAKLISFKQIGKQLSPTDTTHPVFKVYVADKLLGESYNQYTRADSTLPVIFRLNGKSLNPNNQAHIAQLAKAKKFDFYEFGNGRISHMKLAAPNGICQDFRHGKGVKFDIATTYFMYDESSQTFPTANFIGYFIDGTYVGEQFIIDNYSLIVSNIASSAFQEKYSAAMEAKGDKLPNANAAEKGRMLDLVICR